MDKKNRALLITLPIIGTVALVTAATLFYLFAPAIFHMSKYKGEHPHLYTVAVYSLLTDGCIRSAETIHASNVTKVDEDDYGRELFIYEGSPVAFNEEFRGVCSVLVCQKHDDNFTYWYDCDNYILAPYYGYDEERDNGVEEDPYKGITAEQIAQLKEKNDWGKAVDESKLSRAKIVREPLTDNLGKGERVKLERFYNGLFGEDGYDYRWGERLMRDKDGRTIYYVDGDNYKKGNDYETDYKRIIVMASPEGEFYEDGWFIFDSPKTYAENLNRIKQATGWNMKTE